MNVWVKECLRQNQREGIEIHSYRQFLRIFALERRAHTHTTHTNGMDGMVAGERSEVKRMIFF